MKIPELLPTSYDDGIGRIYLRAFTGTDVVYSRKGCMRGVCSLREWLSRCHDYGLHLELQLNESEDSD